jgi:hypothetical protein
MDRHLILRREKGYCSTEQIHRISLVVKRFR